MKTHALRNGVLLALGGLFFGEAFLLSPVHAAQSCSPEGFKIVYINGIFTEREVADDNTKKFIRKYNESYPGALSEKNFINGYNPTHIAGVGDVVKAILQKVHEVSGQTKEDYDLLEIVKQLEPQVTTQRILIVGHSQGTFYANALYDYLIRRGVPGSSLGVVNIATPANFVGGHGTYFTNENDNLVKTVRATTNTLNLPQPLPANMDIPPKAGDEGLFAGHSLANVYLAERPTEIAAAIASALAKLKSEPGREALPCIPPPEGGVAHLAKKATFAVADPAARVVATAYNAVDENATRPLLDATTKLANWLSKFLAYQRHVQVASAASATIPPPEENASEPLSPPPPLETGNFPVSQNTPLSSPLPAQETEDTAEPPAPQVLQKVPPPPPPPPVLGFGGLLSLVPGFGAGGGGGGALAPAAAPVAAPAPAPIPDPALSVTSPAADTTEATTTLTVSGTSDEGNVVALSYGSTNATTTAAGGAWSFTLVLPEGATTLSFVANDANGRTSGTVSRTVTVDTVPPEVPTLSADECAYSFSPSACVIPEASATVRWSDAAGAAGYRLYVDGALLYEGAATSTSAALSSGATTTLAVVAHDAAGNAATSSELTIARLAQSLIINEVAWAGTTASSTDEWVELKNLSSYPISLSRFALVSEDGGLFLPLSGTIGAATTSNLSDLYLIERRSGATTAVHALEQSFESLSDSGEELRLVFVGASGTTTVDRTPSVATCAGWCAGSLPTAIRYSVSRGNVTAVLSMERVAGATDGSLSASWRSHDTYEYEYKDTSNNTLFGTPGRENSAGNPSFGWRCGGPWPVSGGSYTPEHNWCSFYSGFIHQSANRYGILFRGTIGSSTLEDGASLGVSLVREQYIGIATSSPGDPFFTVVFEKRNGPAFSNEVNDFIAWFEHGTTTTGSIDPPHTNYRVLEWVYGP